MMFLLQIADTTGYMIAGYVVIFGALFLYIASLVVRHRNLNQDYEMLKEIENRKK